jgi:6,7-dimethyl-8-ribityllumazine synthase
MLTIEGQLSARDLRCAIVVSRFNSLVSKQLLDGAMDCLLRHGGNDQLVTVIHVPGAFEIPQVAMSAAASKRFDAILCLGAVIRGDTPHFDYLAAEAAKGIAQVGMNTGVPVAFGILTTDTLEQALERAGAKAGNKGWDAALTVMELSHVLQQVREGRKAGKE